MKKALSILLILALICIPLAACGGTEETPPTSAPPAGNDPTPAPPAGNDPTPAPPPSGGDIENVTLMVWGGEEDQAMLRRVLDEFIANNADEVNLTINLGVESESTAKDTILIDPRAAADVFAFADDQIMELYNANVLQEVVINTADIIANNSGGAVAAATVNGTLYAYPMTADNGYFMFYDASYFTAADVESFDRMMEVAAAAGKQITMSFDSGWYNIAFFRGAGFNAWLGADGSSTETDINSAGGTDVVQAMLDIAGNPGFISLGDAEFVTGINNGTIIAGINGPWNASAAEEAWGSNYAASKLPTFTLNGNQIQMGGVIGCKLIGVNAFSENPYWAMLLAEWLTNYENQVLRFEERGQGPSNILAASSDAVQASPALAALADQARFSAVLLVGGNFWAPTETLGAIIAHGNPDRIDLQTLLDNAVAGITS